MSEAARACSNRRRALIGSWVTPPMTSAIEIEQGGDENITINHGCRQGEAGQQAADDSKGQNGSGKRQQGERQNNDSDG